MQEIIIKAKKNQKDCSGMRPIERKIMSLIISRILKTRVITMIFLMIKIFSCFYYSIYSISLF